MGGTGLIIVKMVALVLSLGIDTLMMSISLGFLQTRGKVKIALTFSGAEALMPVVGLIIGQTVGRVIGDWAALVGGLALVAVAAWLIFFGDEDDEEEKLERELMGWTLVLTALSISLDELAVGFSIGMIGVPVGLTIVLIAIQAFLFTLVGLTFGSKLQRYFGGNAEKFAGLVLGVLGLWITMEAVVHLLHP
jgi:putative Mn2+ efflux pump MntP